MTVTGRLTCADDECHAYVSDLLVDMVAEMETRGFDEASFGAEFALNRFTGHFVLSAQSREAGRAAARGLLEEVCDVCGWVYEDDHGKVLVDDEYEIERVAHLIEWTNFDLQQAA